MTYTTLISTAELANHLGDPDWAIIDCRFDLARPDWGQGEYVKAHIPGAVYAHLDRDLSGPITPASGRHPLPAPEAFTARASAWGIGPATQVVVYDTAGGAFAVRLWWLLRLYGHTAVAVLDGGLPLWEAQGRPLRSGSEARPAARFTGTPQVGGYVTATDVVRLRRDPAWRIIDARAPQRYAGEEEPIDPVAGHIPGAVNRFHGANLAADGTFLSPDELRRQFLDLLDGVAPENAVVYCGSGVTSCHHLLAMEVAGLHPGRLYPGSWSEWIRDPDRPRSIGPEPG